ncbi:MAG TPA: hypothetical protein VJH03_10650 [Blastocatellia bacterium]|nr:hypothetical protein [Blastocatellia bacterium]
MSSDARNWLERLSQKIPGYSGYVDRERRRDIDKLHREHLADRLRSLKAPLTDLIRELTDEGRLFEVGPVDLAIKKLDRLENRIRFASYGYAGFFDLVKIEQPQLDAIYRFDLGLVEQIEKLEAKVRAARDSAGTPDGLKQAATDVAAEVDSIDRGFDERYRAINEFGQGAGTDQPPGRPLFS